MRLSYLITVWFTYQISLVLLNICFLVKTLRFDLALKLAYAVLFVCRFITFHNIFLTIVQMYRFIVHCFIRNKNQPSKWILAEYTFGHKNLETCQMWVNQLNTSLKLEVGRPSKLLVCSLLVKDLLYNFFYWLLIMNFPRDNFWFTRFLFIQGVGKVMAVEPGKLWLLYFHVLKYKQRWNFSTSRDFVNG